MQIEQLLPYLSPTAQAFVTQAMQQGQQDVIDTILQVVSSAPDVQTGVAMVEQAIQEFLQQGGVPGQDPAAAAQAAPGQAVGGAPVSQDPNALPGAPGGVQPPMDPNAMPPDMNPGMGGPPPQNPGMGGPQGQPPPAGAPAPAPQETPPPEPPKYKLPSVPKIPMPTYQQVLDDAEAGREYWAKRDARIRLDQDLYHLVYDYSTLGSTDTTVVGATVMHRRTQPNTLVDLVTSLCTAKNGKLQTEIEPRSDADDYKAAAQDAEDAVLCWRMDDEERWLESRINEPPLPRKEAGLAALEGGFGWSWTIDAENEECPFQYEIIPLSQLYDVGHACTRQYTLPLHQARARFDAIKEAYPDDGKGRNWDPNMTVRIIIHADNAGVWRSIVWEEVPSRGSRSKAKSVTGGSAVTPVDNDEKWILKPEKVNFGFRYFSYMTWGGSPAEALLNGETNIQAYKGHGVLTMLRKTFRLVDMWVSALATGAIRAVDPAWVYETDTMNPQEPDASPGAFIPIKRGDKVYPLQYEFSKNADAGALIQSLLAELSALDSPALIGAPGPSGIAQQQSTDQASQQVVGPIIDALEKWYALQHKQRLMLALRYSGDTKYNKDANGKDNTLFEKYPKRRVNRNTNEYGYIKAGDIEKSGVRAKVTYTDRSTQETMALAQVVTQLTGAHLMSQETALRTLGVKDPQKEMLRILADGAYQDPTVLKALVEAAVYNSGNQDLINAWNKAFYADMVKGSQGSQPAPAGQASMPNPADMAASTSSANVAPGQQQMGNQGY
jgi:hypothetical protein